MNPRIAILEAILFGLTCAIAAWALLWIKLAEGAGIYFSVIGSILILAYVILITYYTRARKR